MKTTLPQLIVLLIVGISLTNCAKEKNWSTSVVRFDHLSHYHATVEARYEMPRNNDETTIGLCWSESPNPTLLDHVLELEKSTEAYIKEYHLEDLSPDTRYYVRSYIALKTKKIIYSSEHTFTTEKMPEPPCETEPGIVSFSGTTIGMGGLTEITFDEDYYELRSTSLFYGQLDFKFKQKPTLTDLYETSNAYELGDNEISVSGIYGGGFSCSYSAGNNQDVYVTVDENGKISITFCNFEMSTNQSCETYQYLDGEVREP